MKTEKPKKLKLRMKTGSLFGFEGFFRVSKTKRYLFQIVKLRVDRKVKKKYQLVIQRYKNVKGTKAIESFTVVVAHYKTMQECFERASRFAKKKGIANKVIAKIEKAG